MSTQHEPASAGTPDPSMDDILASIRRILDEEEAKPGEVRAPAEPVAVSMEDVLELDSSMMLPDPEEMAPGPVPVPPPILMEPVKTEAAIPMPVPVAIPMPAPALSAPALPAPAPLVAPEAAAAAAVSVGALMRTLASERTAAVHRGGPTIEDLVREEMRPLLKEWLDLHLAPMVERLVRAEIERVVSRMT